MSAHRLLRVGAVAGLIALANSSALAQWTVIPLNPVGSTYSQAFAASGHLQVGSTVVDNVFRASMWSGTAASWIDLNPAGAERSTGAAASGNQQGGGAVFGGVPHAGMWSGSAASWVDLHPAGSASSGVTAMSGGLQAGWAFVGDVQRACVWSGTAASWVDLHPAGARASRVHAASGNQQAGEVWIGFTLHASLWGGTAASWVDLHPPVASQSQAYAVSGGLQAGWASVGGRQHACLWRGTAASWVDLHPAVASVSEVYGASGNMQVGQAVVGNSRASLWSGTAASWVDLHALVPAEFSDSIARGISSDESYLYVAGWARNSNTDSAEPLLWKRPLCLTGPTIGNQAQPTAACRSGSATFSVTASSNVPITYQWQHEYPVGTWFDIDEGPNTGMATATGIGNATLVLTNLGPIAPGRYRVLVTNACGSVVSAEALLTICAGDFNCSGDATVQDIFDFINSYFAGESSADINGVDGVTVQDIFDFLAAYFAGCA